ncbi:hypothetical protein [Rubrivirga sp. IMCC43871]|uniref:hypothetical protein n=1 Tax=Rubrivirga sp. IMCC43871 TaxID=3391575 RepID=UPI00398FD33F
MSDSLTGILYALQKSRQRATYGAVAGVLNAVPRFVMRGRPKDPLHSWVVSAKNGRPSGYPDDAMHADLEAHEQVISTSEDLAAWLAEHA